MSMRPPSEALLKAAERKLRQAAPRAQRAVGGGIYMRLDANGRRRFQFRTRRGGSQAAGTFDSWIEAVAARDERDAALAESAELGALDSASDLRRMTVKQYAPLWWKHVLNDCEVLTQADYKYGLGMALAVAGDFTLEQLDRAPLVGDEIKTRLRKLKTRPQTAKHRPGEFTKAAADKGLKALSNICTHAVDAGAMTRNPFDGIQYFNNTRGPNGKKSNGHRAIKVSEVLRPELIAEIGLGVRGSVATIEQDRLVAELIAFGGLRPQVICAMRHRWWRDTNGPRTHMLIEDAVKDVSGHLMLGEPKTGKYEPVIWPAIAEQLERVYQAQGCPSLDALTVPNEKGTLLAWGNWRRRWYRSLFKAGIAKENDSSAEGAFDPYLCRHIGVVTMLHAQRPAAIGGGNYSRYEVAKHHGHTVETLDNVYAGIPQDLFGIAGMTMDEIVRAGRRAAWGPIPGDADYEEILYTTVEASQLTGLGVNLLSNRARLGNLPARRQGHRYLISDHDLVLVGLLAPRHRR